MKGKHMREKRNCYNVISVLKYLYLVLCSYRNRYILYYLQRVPTQLVFLTLGIKYPPKVVSFTAL